MLPFLLPAIPHTNYGSSRPSLLAWPLRTLLVLYSPIIPALACTVRLTMYDLHINRRVSLFLFVRRTIRTVRLHKRSALACCMGVDDPMGRRLKPYTRTLPEYWNGRTITVRLFQTDGLPLQSNWRAVALGNQLGMYDVQILSGREWACMDVGSAICRLISGKARGCECPGLTSSTSASQLRLIDSPSLRQLQGLKSLPSWKIGR